MAVCIVEIEAGRTPTVQLGNMMRVDPSLYSHLSSSSLSFLSSFSVGAADSSAAAAHSGTVTSHTSKDASSFYSSSGSSSSQAEVSLSQSVTPDELT
eukprot:gb/GEZN01032813.1/.p1 GENE.gb/GEZN01032813.1/~~gb/GEZN01032813.1/.p1  ORF type:complete len:107 (+),score=30.72 gb/GEZN01032813.1/:31-321(+)